MLSLIVAHDSANVIGYRGKLPWHVPSDLKRFKKITMGKTLIMGRKTFDSVGILPGRLNIVVTRNWDFRLKSKVMVTSREYALELIKQQHDREFIICGGAKIYNLFKNDIDHKLYISKIKGLHFGDTYFPDLNFDKFKLCYHEKQYDHTYYEYDHIGLHRKP